MNIIESFDALLDWKKLPAYRAEPRVDFIVAGALPEILKERYKEEIKLIIPELPIRIGSIYPKININKSYKVDFYILLDGGKNIFIEFKTDSNSRRNKQDEYLQAAKNVGMKKILEGIIEISKASKYKTKYSYLLNKLISHSLIFSAKDASKIKVKKSIKDKIDILYIQPKSKNQNEIGFDEIAEIMKNSNDKFYKHFSKILKSWSNN